MSRIIEHLKTEIARRGFTPPSSEETFEVLASQGCEQCCAGYGGGNGTCPPPKWET